MKSLNDIPRLNAAFWALAFSLSSMRSRICLSLVMGFRFIGIMQVYTIVDAVVVTTVNTITEFFPSCIFASRSPILRPGFFEIGCRVWEHYLLYLSPGCNPGFMANGTSFGRDSNKGRCPFPFGLTRPLQWGRHAGHLGMVRGLRPLCHWVSSFLSFHIPSPHWSTLLMRFSAWSDVRKRFRRSLESKPPHFPSSSARLTMVDRLAGPFASTDSINAVQPACWLVLELRFLRFGA